MHDGSSRRPLEPRLRAISIILVDVALWVLLGLTAQLAIRLIR
jgi:hypothetical protein